MRFVPPRRGFTLLEVTLALSVAVLLLGALYVAVEVQLRHARAGRDIVEQATLVRSILARVDADVTSAATLIDPERYRTPAPSSGGSSAGTTGSSGGATAGATGAGAAGGGTATGSAGSTGGTAGSAAATTGGTNDAITLPLSVQGDSTSLHLFISRVPREAIPADPNAAPLVASDSRRVSWWLTSGGLARQEVGIATSQDALENLPPGIPDEDSYVLAPEVKTVQFQYFDGTDWQDSWDCTTPGADGVTPVGPPQAVAVVIEVTVPQDGPGDDEAPTKRYRHVVACLTANGATQQQTGTGGTGK